MKKTRHIITDALRDAIAKGVKKTRKEWAADLNTSYFHFCTLVSEFGLQDAILSVRAEAPESGILKVIGERRNTKHEYSVVRIPGKVLRAAGIDARHVHYQAEPGRIVITV